MNIFLLLVARTLAHDFMHDILEGVLPLEMKALLKYFFSENLIKLDLINLKLQSLILLLAILR